MKPAQSLKDHIDRELNYSLTGNKSQFSLCSSRRGSEGWALCMKAKL